MIAQLDLFGGTAAAPPPRRGIVALPLPAAPLPRTPPPPDPIAIGRLLPPPSDEWARRLNANAMGAQVTIQCSCLWTGAILEVLNHGAEGRWMIDRDMVIREIAADAGAVGRIVYVTPLRAAELHAQWPLVLLGAPGTHSARYRLGGPDDPRGTPLILPPAASDAEVSP